MGALMDVHLPVNIIVRDALIRNVEIVTPGTPNQPPFKLDRIALDARSELGSDVVHVRGLDVDGPTFKLRAQGDLTPVGDYPVDLRAQATYDDAQYPPFVVSGAFKGTLEKLALDARLAQPFAAHVTGDVIAPMRELEMDLAAQVQGFEAQKINPEWPVARVSQGNVKIKGKLDDFVSEGKVAGAYEGYGKGEATYRLARRGEDFIFEYLNLRTENGAELSARGTVGTEEKDLDLDLVAEWQRFAWPLQGGPPVVVSRSGEAKITGSLADYKVDVDAQLAGPGIPPGRWILAGQGTQEKMDIRSLRGDVLEGRLAAAGQVTWKPQVTWNVKLNGNGLNPGALYPEWPGSLAFAATSNGTLEDAGPYGQVDLLNVDGNLRGNPVAGRVRLELAGDQYRLPRLDLRSGSARVTAAGSFTKDAGNLDWKLEAPNLGEALPDAGGAVTAQGHLAGPWKSPRVRAQANGQSLVFRTYNANTLALVADVDLASNGPIQIDLDATNVGLGERRFDTVALDGRGTRRAHEVTLAVKAPEGTLDLALAGGLVGTTSWNGQIRRLDLANEQTGTWSLAGPAGLAAGTERAALRDFCFTSAANDNARLCAQGDWAKTGPWTASGIHRGPAVHPLQAVPAAGPGDHGRRQRHLPGAGDHGRLHHRQRGPAPRAGGDPLPDRERRDGAHPLRPGAGQLDGRAGRPRRPRQPDLRGHRRHRGRAAAAAVQRRGRGFEVPDRDRPHPGRLLQPGAPRSLRLRHQEPQGHPECRPRHPGDRRRAPGRGLGRVARRPGGRARIRPGSAADRADGHRRSPGRSSAPGVGPFGRR